MDLEPLVSCVMPTSDRRRFVPSAIRYFQRQDYPHRELVIIDDGRDPVGDLVPSDDPTIRYIRVDDRLVTGAKRNRACQEADGDIIVHWDDDDWFAPWRIRYQVDELVRSETDLCGLSDLLFLDIDGERGWRYRYPKSKRPWVAGGTMAYRRSLWERCPFPEVRQGEDTQFLWKQKAVRISVLNRTDFYVAMIHGANTSRKQTSTRRWTVVPANEIFNLLGDDRTWYRPRSRAATNGRRPGNQGASAGVPTTIEAETTNLTGDASPNPASSLAGAEADTRGHHVVVSIPHFGSTGYLRTAVDSILAQTHRNLTLVVVFDGDRGGWETLDDIDDPRLVRFELEANRGRYFADQVVLEAIAEGDDAFCEFFVVQDSDDWSDPRRVEVLLAKAIADEADVCVSATLEHNQRRRRERVTRTRSPRLDEPVTAELVHRAGHQGLYRVERLAQLGGWYAGFRIGFDTSILNLLLMTGAKVICVNEALYHRRIHGASLTTSRDSGWGSAARQEAVAQLKALHRTAMGLATAAVDDQQSTDEIRALLRSRWSGEDEVAMREESKRLARRLRAGNPPAAPVAPVENQRARPTVRRVEPQVPDVYAMIDRGVVDGLNWSVSPRGAIEIYEHILKHRSRRILDVGSGISTLVAAAAASRVGGHVVSLEHDSRYQARTEKLLFDHGVRHLVTLKAAPLKSVRIGQREAPWYDTQLDGQFDFIIINGPPLPMGGREAVLHHVAGHRRRNWQIWLFDGNRPHERGCVDRWSQLFRFVTRHTALDETGVIVLTPRQRVRTNEQPVVPDLGVSILTGGRPDQLARTLAAFEARWSAQLDAAYVLGFVNGADESSLRMLRERHYIDRLISHDTSVLGIGAATSFAMAAVSAQASVKAVLHLEDDWEAISLDSDALVRAAEILEDPEIGQVRLRHRSERVLAKHMVTGAPILWSPHHSSCSVADAHYTFNPSLVRTETIDQVFPAEHELDAQRRFLQTGQRVAQLSPGAFIHTGGESGGKLSRRRQVGVRTAVAR